MSDENQSERSNRIREELWTTFFQEIEELLEKLEHELLKIESDKSNPDLIASLFRTMHTFKGTSGMMGLTGIESLAHKAEDVMDLVREGKVEMTDDLLDHLFEALDTLKVGHEVVVENKSDESLDLPQDLLTAFEGYLNPSTAHSEEAVQAASLENKADTQPELATETPPALDNATSDDDRISAEHFFEQLWPLLSSLRKTIEKKAQESETFDIEDKLHQVELFVDQYNEVDLDEYTTQLHQVLASDETDKSSALGSQMQELYTYCWDLEDQLESKHLTKSHSTTSPQAATVSEPKEDETNISESEEQDHAVVESQETAQEIKQEAAQEAEQNTTQELIQENLQETQIPQEKLTESRVAENSLVTLESLPAQPMTQELDNLQQTVGKLISVKSNLSQLSQTVIAKDIFTLIEKELKLHEGNWIEAKDNIREQLHDFDSDIKELIQAQEDLGTVLDGLQTDVNEIRQAPLSELLNRIKTWHGEQKSFYSTLPELLITVHDELQIERSLIPSLHQALMIVLNDILACFDKSKDHSEENSQQPKIEFETENTDNEIVLRIKLAPLTLSSTWFTEEKRETLIPAELLTHNVQLDWVEEHNIIAHLDFKISSETQVFEGIIVNLDNIAYVFPVSIVQRIVNMEDAEYQEASASDQQKFIKVNQKLIPLTSLHNTIQIREGCRQVILILSYQNQERGIIVDELLGLQQVLVTPIKGTLEKSQHVQGHTILGRDQIGMVVSPAQLFQ